MTAYETLQSEVAYGWRKLHGRAGVYIYRPVSPIGCIIYLLKLYLQNNINRHVCIIAPNRELSRQIREAVNTTFEYHNISVQFVGYIKDIMFLNGFELIITVNINDIKKLETLVIKQNVKHYLAIFDARELGKETIKREALMPIVQLSVNPNKIIEDYIHSPVKETLIATDLEEDEYKSYKEYDDYVRQSMRIFGNFEVLDRCRIGNKIMNQTAIEVCEVVASNNGWNYEIDASTDFGREIDNTFNPNALHDRANQTYNNIRERKNIVVSSKNKLIEIAKIVEENKGKKIIIVSAKGSFAHDIAEYLNKMYPIVNTEDYIRICGEYHNDIPDCVQKDKGGKTVTYKTGEKAGQPKIIGWKKQSSLAVEDYILDDIDVLSIKSASDVNLMVDCDILICTSPFAGHPYDIKRRFHKTLFRSAPFEIYTLYNRGTIEEKEVNKREQSPIYDIIRIDDNIFVSD